MKNIKLILASTLALIGVFSSGSVHAALSVNDIQKKITQSGATWKAKSNWMTSLPRTEVIRMLGAQDVQSTEAEFIAPFRKSLVNESMDWRNHNGVNFVGPVLNQGNCGSCVAFASVATLETQTNITTGIPGFFPNFSTQAHFACGGGACEFGWQPQLAAKFLQQTGVPDEACAPYTMGSTGETVSCNTICKDSAQRSTKILSFSKPSTGTLDIAAVKEALKKGPLVTTLLVYEDFLSYSSGVYKHVAGTSLGGHAVSLVGFDDTTRSWIIRNSWGEEWGEGGFARISWDDISGISNQTWGYQVAPQKGYVRIIHPHGRMFLSGKVDMQVESTFAKTSKLEVQIIRPGTTPSQPPLSTLSCLASNCVLPFDTTTLKDGYYQAVATVTYDGGTQSRSEYEQFYVLNGAVALTLNAVPQKGVDLTKPLKDRIEFDLTTNTQTEVPMSLLEFIVKDMQGKVVFSRNTSMVLPKMTVGWRTNALPNGRYEFSFRGTLSTPDKTVSTQTQSAWVTTQN